MKTEITIKAQKSEIDRICKAVRQALPEMPKAPDVEVIGSDGRNVIFTRIFVLNNGKG